MDEQWLTVNDAADALGVTERTVRRRMSKGQVEYEKRSGRIYVKVSVERVESPDDVIYRLKLEIEKLESLLEAANSERDYLRSMLAMNISKDQKQIEARSYWWQFWKDK